VGIGYFNRWKVPALTLALAFWGAAIAVGMVALLRHELTPGTTAAAAAAVPGWPAGSSLRLASDGRPTLVMFAHPKCPCTRASLSLLQELLGRAGSDSVSANVVFMNPARGDDDWQASPTWRTAKAIPGLVLANDRGGAEATRFGVQTSGHTLLFDAQGALLFSGGLTASRGHEGESLAFDHLLALLRRGSTIDPAPPAPVFGCTLSNSDSENRDGGPVSSPVKTAGTAGPTAPTSTTEVLSHE
jgi:hypothetical protein